MQKQIPKVSQKYNHKILNNFFKFVKFSKSLKFQTNGFFFFIIINFKKFCIFKIFHTYNI